MTRSGPAVALRRHRAELDAAVRDGTMLLDGDRYATTEHGRELIDAAVAGANAAYQCTGAGGCVAYQHDELCPTVLARRYRFLPEVRWDDVLPGDVLWQCDGGPVFDPPYRVRERDEFTLRCTRYPRGRRRVNLTAGAEFQVWRPR